jgi:hypothetical protein
VPEIKKGWSYYPREGQCSNWDVVQIVYGLPSAVCFMFVSGIRIEAISEKCELIDVDLFKAN